MKKYHGYLKPWEVSKYLGLPLEEVCAMIDSGELPHTTLNGERRVPWEQLEAWLDEEVNESELVHLSKHLPNVQGKEVQEFLDSQKNPQQDPHG